MILQYSIIMNNTSIVINTERFNEEGDSGKDTDNSHFVQMLSEEKSTDGYVIKEATLKEQKDKEQKDKGQKDKEKKTNSEYGIIHNEILPNTILSIINMTYFIFNIFKNNHYYTFNESVFQNYMYRHLIKKYDTTTIESVRPIYCNIPDENSNGFNKQLDRANKREDITITELELIIEYKNIKKMGNKEITQIHEYMHQRKHFDNMKNVKGLLINASEEILEIVYFFYSGEDEYPSMVEVLSKSFPNNVDKIKKYVLECPLDGEFNIQ